MSVLSRRPLELGEAMRQVSAALSADELDEAARLLRDAGASHPTRADIFAALARVELKRSDMDAHDAAIAQAIALAPRQVAYQIRAAIACPPMMSTIQEIDRIRSRSQERLEALSRTLIHQPGLQLSDPLGEVPTRTYYFTYHGRDDRHLNRMLASVLQSVHPALGMSAPHVMRPRAPGGMIRLGILSTYLRDHTIGQLFTGLIQRLSPHRFRRVLIFSESDLDERSVALAESGADEVVLIPRHLAAAREVVARQQLDVLWYPDLGMDSFTLYLAHARLARAQVTTWGHPNTSGVPAVDAFLSLDALEPDRPAGPYTEALLCQSAPNIYYTPTRLRARLPRTALGLPATGNLYGCPQTLFKMHPDFDRVLCGILARDPQAVLVLHQGRTRRWRELFLSRLEAHHPGVGARIFWLQSMPRPQYIQTLSALDVMLDPFPFGGGNTTLEALAVDTPVVTLPPRLARGRLAAAFYDRLGWSGAVAHDRDSYIDLAVRFATDPVARATAVAAIRRGGPRLYENLDGVRQFEDLLTDSFQRFGGPAGAPLR